MSIIFVSFVNDNLFCTFMACRSVSCLNRSNKHHSASTVLCARVSINRLSLANCLVNRPYVLHVERVNSVKNNKYNNSNYSIQINSMHGCSTRSSRIKTMSKKGA